jgi:hypothetical protein
MVSGSHGSALPDTLHRERTWMETGTWKFSAGDVKVVRLDRGLPLAHLWVFYGDGQGVFLDQAGQTLELGCVGYKHIVIHCTAEPRRGTVCLPHHRSGTSAARPMLPDQWLLEKSD